jgi:GNAT superfamily N-acetyltransferase
MQSDDKKKSAGWERLRFFWKRLKFVAVNLLTEPCVTVHMQVDNEPHLRYEDGDGWLHHYQYFTQPHPRYRLVGNKVLGVAMLAVPDDFAAYYESVNGKNSAAYYARKAKSRGYTIREIDRNDYVDDLIAIHDSKDLRQGKPLAPEFFKRKQYSVMPNYRYWGVLDTAGRLVAYAWVAYYNEVALVSGLMGHADHLNNGIMYYLMLHIIEHAAALKKQGHPLNYIMYDTFFGASSGMIMFKQKLAFQPYRVKWRP